MYVDVWIYLSLKQGVALLLCLHWVCDDDPGPHSDDVEKWGCLGSEPRCTGGDMSTANWWLLHFKPNARWRPYQKCSGLQGFGAPDGLVWKLRKTPVDLCRTDWQGRCGTWEWMRQRMPHVCRCDESGLVYCFVDCLDLRKGWRKS